MPSAKEVDIMANYASPLVYASRNEFSKCKALIPCKCMMFLCDIQTGYEQSVEYFTDIVKNSYKLKRVADIMKLDIVISQTQGKGPIVAELTTALNYRSEIRPSSQLSAVTHSMISDIQTNGYQSAILCGMECHGAIQATAMELKRMGLDVFVVIDACSSRVAIERGMGFGYLKHAGCHLLTTETAINTLASHLWHAPEIIPILLEDRYDAGISSMDSVLDFNFFP